MELLAVLKNGQREVFSTIVNFDIIVGSDADLTTLELSGDLASLSQSSLVTVTGENRFWYQSNDDGTRASSGGDYETAFETEYETFGAGLTDENGDATSGYRASEGFSNSSRTESTSSGSRREQFSRSISGALIGHTVTNTTSSSESGNTSESNEYNPESEPDNPFYNHDASRYQHSYSADSSSTNTYSVTIDPLTGERVVFVSLTMSSSYGFSSSASSSTDSNEDLEPILVDHYGGDDDDSGDGTDDDDDSGSDDDTSPTDEFSGEGSEQSSSSSSVSQSGSGSRTMNFTSRLGGGSFASSLGFFGTDNGNASSSEQGSATRNSSTTNTSDERTITVTTDASSNVGGNGSGAGN